MSVLMHNEGDKKPGSKEEEAKHGTLTTEMVEQLAREGLELRRELVRRSVLPMGSEPPGKPIRLR